MKIDYSEPDTPPEYKCACGASGCKLWREYQTFSPKLICATCAANECGEDISDINADGMRNSEFGRTDQIGQYVPAVPDEEGVGYWGYTSIPESGCSWWCNLPTLPSNNNKQ